MKFGTREGGLEVVFVVGRVHHGALICLGLCFGFFFGVLLGFFWGSFGFFEH